MNSNSHGIKRPPLQGVMGGEVVTRPNHLPTSFRATAPLLAAIRVAASPEAAAHPHCCAASSYLLAGMADGRAAPSPQCARHPHQSARPAAALGPARRRNDEIRTAEGIGAAARGAGLAFARAARGGAISFHDSLHTCRSS